MRLRQQNLHVPWRLAVCLTINLMGETCSMDKKYIFSQSDDKTAADQPAKKDKFSSMLKELMEVPFYTARDTAKDQNKEQKKTPEFREDDGIMQFIGGTNVLDEVKKNTYEEPKADDFDVKSFSNPASKPREESYITKDIVINGSISAVSNIKIDGTVNGNITCENDVTVCGTVEGDVSANNVKFLGAQIKGDISCKNGVTFDKDAVVNGNVTGKKIEINGKIKGNINVELGAVIMGNAVIFGDVTASSISVSEGAVIKGNIQITRSYDAGDTGVQNKL